VTPAGQPDQVVERVGLDGEAAGETPLVGDGLVEDAAYVVVGQRLQPQ
jgi:hypothetical protein